MAPPDGNLQDYFALSQDTLSHKGAQFAIGTTSASTVSVVFSNSAGALALAAAATGNATVWLPPGGGSLLANVNVSAGTTSQNLSNFVLSNSNGVSFGLNGSTLTGSVAVGGANINLSAGTTSNLASAFTFSNANGVSFGLNASTLTASIATSLTNINLSAGTTSQNLSNVVFSNSNGISFGLNGSTITAAASGVIAVLAGAGVATSGSVVFSNSNGITFGMAANVNASVITASVNSLLTNLNVSAGTTSNLLSAITFSNSNGVTFGLNAGVITASYIGLNLSAGTTSQNLSFALFSNSNAVSFGLNGSTVTASYALNVSAGTTSQNLTALVLSNSNGLSFGQSGSTITAELAGFSSWSNGAFVTTFATSGAFLSLQPIIVPYCITVSNLVQLMSVSGITNSSGGFSMSAVLYTINLSTLSLASSGSSNFTWTSGAAYSSSSGVQYLQMSVNSWSLTPGPYVFGLWLSTQNSASLTIFGNQSGVSISSGLGAALTGFAFDGISASSIAALPASIGISNTSGYLRTGASANNQPWFLIQGT